MFKNPSIFGLSHLSNLLALKLQDFFKVVIILVSSSSNNNVNSKYELLALRNIGRFVLYIKSVDNKYFHLKVTFISFWIFFENYE